MGFHHALSGLNAASKSLDIIGHNIANSGTTAFKTSRAEFSEAVASALGSASGESYGIGVTTAAVTQQFKQGNLKPTGNNLDVAINGNGFFIVATPDESIAYSRSGSFHVDQNGFLRNVHGDQILGKYTDAGAGRAEGLDVIDNKYPMKFETGTLLEAKATTNVDIRLNLDARAQNAAGNASAIPPIAATPRSTYGTSLNVYDQQGATTPINLYFEKSDSNQWSIYSGLDDMSVTPPVINPSTGFIQMDSVGRPKGIAQPSAYDSTHSAYPTELTYTFADSAGNVQTATIIRDWTFTDDGATPPNVLTASYVDYFNDGSTIVPLTASNFSAFEATGTASTTTSAVDFTLKMMVDSSKYNPNNPDPFEINVNLNEITQYGVGFSVTKLDQDGYKAGQLNNISISEDGSIIAQYDNGIKQKEGQLMLATFRNNQGLASIGGDKWASTKESGLANEGAPKTGIFGSLHSSTLEESNVDLTAELVDMMTAQRAYQASAQAIKTQDQVFSTLVNLR